MRRHDQINAFRIKTDRHEYIVTLERLNNSACGTPRFHAVIIVLSQDKSMYNAVYTFNGHYRNDYGEAEWIVAQYEEEAKKND